MIGRVGLLAALLAWSAPQAARAQLVDPATRDTVAGEIADRLTQLRSTLQARPGGILGLMGYTIVPDGSANSVTLSRGTTNFGTANTTLTLSQFGFGFTLSESFPLWLEAYAGYARYDPRAVFSGGQDQRSTPARWNNFTTTLGVGYDIALAQYLWLRPILNVAGGFAAADSTLFGAFIERRTGADLSGLTDRHVNVWGIGGAMMLAYYDYRPERDIDVELRYTNILLQTFGDTPRGARQRSDAQTLGLWARLRWPTGWEAFGRPVRWVLDGNASTYFGDQERALGFAWAVKIGGGIEIDVGRYEIGAVGISLSRLRLVGRYFIGDNNVTGTSIGIGMSF
ncbi:hypothetical protein [Roseomonas fluvialis]|uniref:Autotransporter domain-containing protein n=1 Tax=Roseomonas fluvialis TaxID=1750527 RepID=A0ABN6P6B3_9PROT|nr:hypothetical protein [Roseomonas fluvialis]BDG72845.1 hypothetical protein Rmf_27740 [Roseomonas fluvialis]